MWVSFIFCHSQRLSNPLSERTREERGSHTPPEDRRARSSGAGWGYLRQRRIPLFQAFRQIGIYISAKMVNMFLELLDEQADMISVADSVMYLYCEWKHAFTFPLKVFSHCENRQQEMSVIKNVYVEPGKFQPRNHRDVE